MRKWLTYKTLFYSMLIIVSALLFLIILFYLIYPERPSTIEAKIHRVRYDFRTYTNSLENDHGFHMIGKDPFTRFESSYRTVISTGTIYVISIGPDLQYQTAKIDYDPSNGIVSRGDIYLKLVY